MSAFHQLEDIPPHVLPVAEIKVISGQNLMMFWTNVKAGTHIDRHAHPNEQITWLMSGSMRFQIGDDDVRSCGPGTIVTVAAGVLHETWYTEHCTLVEVFNPPRFDLFPHAATNPYGFEQLHPFSQEPKSLASANP